MCGIAGLQGDFPAELLGRMSAAIAHRGPDGDGCAVFPGPERRGSVGLAHRRLAIIDLSEGGREPLTLHCPCCGCAGLDDLAITYNGELYNYRELRTGLAARGHVFHTQTDIEVLLHLYGEEGPGMLPRLNGIFAFAIRDGRAAGRPAGIQRGDLLLVRDGVGVKPLYYAECAQGLLFASEIKALLRHADLSRELDLTALHYHLAYLWTPTPRTLFASVRKLPPGCAAVVRGGRIERQWSYYDLPYGRPALPGSEAELAEQLRDLVAAAVERQLVADVEVGAFLSGGLDSSAVVAMMKRARPAERPRCYSIGFSGGGIDGAPADLPFARRVAAKLDIRLETIEVGPSIIDRLDQMLYFLDEPQADPAPINALLIAERARDDGLKVLLSGAGGDDIFSGYRRHRALYAERAWTWLPHGPRAALAGAARRVGGGSAGMHRPWTRRFVKLFSVADLAPDQRMAAHFWWSGEALRRSLYSPRLAAELEGEETSAPLLETLGRIPGEHDPLNRMLYLEGKHFLADHNLNYTDKMGMAAGVEVRVPLLDLEVVDFATRVPSRFKQRGRVGKSIFKRAMEPCLPREVIYRDKTGFGAPLRRWVSRELSGRVDEVLSVSAIRSRGLFDPGAVRQLVEQDRAGRIDGAYTVFALMCTELWCRMFVDAPAS